MNTGRDYEKTQAVVFAGEWLSIKDSEQIGRPIIPLLRERFGLWAEEEKEAVREGDLRRARAL
ncbi:hypothetical protein ACVILI_001670 [Mesorhizobium sp. USDA 4775]